MNPVKIVGMGVSEKDLTDLHKQVIAEADMIVGGRRQLELFSDINCETLEITKDLESVVNIIREKMPDHRIVVLASGDPLFFGIGAILIRSLGEDHVEVFPNISSIAAAFSRIKAPWGQAEVVSLHGRNHEIQLLQALGSGRPVAVLTDPEKNPAWIADFILANGFGDCRIGVFEKLGSPEERIGWYDAETTSQRTFSQPNVLILKRSSVAENGKIEPCYLGMEEGRFVHEAGLITKSEVRVVALSKLHLREGQILWDLGAGCGSVSIEACALMPQGHVYAVEKKAERIDHIQSNIRRFGKSRISVIQGKLPGVIDGLPNPDRIFIGGGGKDLQTIIEAVIPRLRSGGIVVANTVLLANIHVACQAFEASGLKVEIVQIQINRSKSMP